MADHMTAEQLRLQLIAIADGLREARGRVPTDDRTITAAVHLLRQLAARLSGMAAVPAELLQWGASLRADRRENDHCTADPVFTVERRRRIFGIDFDYCQEHTWVDDCGECNIEECARLDATYDETGNEPDGYTRCGYMDVWENVASYITPEPAREFASAKGDDYRVMVDSGCRNAQWRALRSFLLALPDPSAPEPPHA